MQHRKRRQLPKKSSKIWLLVSISFLLLASFFWYFFIYSNKTLEESHSEKIQETIPKENEIQKDSIVKKADIKQEALPIKKNQRLPQVEILNGCGVSKIASRFIPFFRKEHLDVISTANYKDFQQKKSFLLYHNSSLRKKVDELAKKLNINTIIPDIQLKATHEITFVIGADYGKLNFKGH